MVQGSAYAASIGALPVLFSWAAVLYFSRYIMASKIRSLRPSTHSIKSLEEPGSVISSLDNTGIAQGSQWQDCSLELENAAHATQYPQ